MGLDISNLSLNTSQIYNSAWKSMPPELLDKFNFVLYLGKIILFLMIAYLLVIILLKITGFFFKVRETKILKNIQEGIQESNKKLAEITTIIHGSKAKKKSS
ncbi:MAG: hypothetical protein Q8Q31_05985 [Nanoarchaeota archaeon]|nr:hypothetical protein [Nanoarchaeota archaeon]